MKKLIKILLLFILLIPIGIKADEVTINSTNAVMFNLRNNEIIYEKEKDQTINIASMQKIMTVLIAVENIEDVEETFVLPDGIFDGLDPELAVVGFSPGDTVSYKDLLYGTLLRSGADAAYALAIEISGSEEEYVGLMNKKVEELGLKNTVYKNTTGLDAEGQYSSVYDMAVILKYAMNNSKFKEIIETPEYTTSDEQYSFTGPVKKAKSLEMDYFEGGKTGFTDLAGLCLASYASYNDVDYILVTAGADQSLNNQNFLDQKTVYDYFMQNYSFQTIVEKGRKIKKIKTMYDDEIELTAKREVTMYLNNSIFMNELDHIYEGNENLDRSIKKGDKIGKYIVKYKDTVLYEEDILSPITVRFKLKKPYVIALVVILGSIILHLFIRSIRRKIRRYRKRRKKRV